MEDEYGDLSERIFLVADTMPDTPTKDRLRGDITALESIVADLRALLSRVETEAP